jgi:hypothetical protein
MNRTPLSNRSQNVKRRGKISEQWGGIRLKMGSGWKMSGCAPRYRVQGRVIGVYFDYAQGKRV